VRRTRDQRVLAFGAECSSCAFEAQVASCAGENAGDSREPAIERPVQDGEKAATQTVERRPALGNHGASPTTVSTEPHLPHRAAPASP